MAEEIRNLGTSPQLKTLGTHIKEATTEMTHTHRGTISHSQPSSKQSLSPSHTPCKQTLYRSHTLCTESLSRSDSLCRSPKVCAEPRPRFQTSSSISVVVSLSSHSPSFSAIPRFNHASRSFPRNLHLAPETWLGQLPPRNRCTPPP